MGYLEDAASALIANGTLPESSGNFSLFGPSSMLIFGVTLASFIIPILIIFPPVPATETDALNETHRKIGVESAQSGLKTQYDQGYNSQVRVHSLWAYPVKSCAGIELAQARVFPTGLQYDRLFMFAQLKSPFPVAVDASEKEKNEHRWEFVTMRQFPRMANVKVEIWVPDEKKLRGKLNPEDRPTESYVIIRFPWQDKGWRGVLQLVGAKWKNGASAEPQREILLPLEFPSLKEIESKGYTMDEVKIWKETVTALNMQCEISAELQRYLGVSNKLTLFRVDPTQLREVYRNAPTKEIVGYQPITGFQDAYPINIMSLSSIRALEEKIEKDDGIEKIDIRRFRANIIVEGGQAYDEETWKRIHIAPKDSSNVMKASFEVCCRCVRCTLPNIDPDTGTRHKVEPDRALRKYRCVDEGAPKKGCMAMQMIPLFGNLQNSEENESWIETGMSVKVDERGKHIYIKM